MKLKSHNFYYLCGIFAASVVFILPVYLYGVPSGNDLPQHFQFAASIKNAVLSGEMYPNWASRENYGYGGVGLRFYPPAAHYVLAFAAILTNNWHAASGAAFLFLTSLAGFGIYFWAREWFSERSSLVAGVLYIFAPYHALQIYGAFLYAEYAAAAVLPFCFLLVTRVCRRGTARDVIGLGIAFGALTFTHLPLSIVGALALFVYALILIEFRLFSSESYKLAAGIGLGLAASSYQWIKVVTEMSWINHASDNFSKAGSYDYAKNFLLSFPYLSGLDFDDRSLWLIDFSLLITLVLTVPPGILFYRKAENRFKKKLLAVFVVSLGSIFMASTLSRPIYDIVPLLQKIQFPWRWMTIVSMSSIIFAAAGCEHITGLYQKRHHKSYFFLIVGGFLIGLTFTFSQIIRQAVYLPESEFSEMSEKFAAAPNFQCWLPIWASEQKHENRVKIAANGGKIDLTEWSGTKVRFDVESGAETAATVEMFYYPHWRGAINDAPIELFPSTEGKISLRIPAGKSAVSIEFTEPTAVELAKYLSLIVWLSMLLFILLPDLGLKYAQPGKFIDQ